VFRYVLSRYELDSEVTRLVDGRRLLLIPTLNPDAIELARLDHSLAGLDTANKEAQQLDSSFTQERDPSKTPEVSAVKDLVATMSPSLVLVLRGGQEGVTYPPSEETDQLMTHFDVESFEFLGKQYSQLAEMPQTESSCGSLHLREGVARDLEVKTTPNSLLDYLFKETSAYGFNIYYSCFGIPAQDQLALLWHKHRDALVKVLGSLNLGVRGFVTDESGRPIPKARVTLQKSNHVTLTGPLGGFWRLLGP
ncbi:UNVERIFIED_CONTAM: hypothetical protein GTU68_041685, partial [Idotea baltica]|nr:hypothetical protein [Idotea baltica]